MLPLYPVAVAFTLSVSGASHDESMLDRLLAIDSVTVVLRYFVVTPAWIMSVGVFLGCFLRQHRVLVRMSRSLPVTLVPTPDYSAISEPFTRLLLFTLVIVAVFPLMNLMVPESVGESAARSAVDMAVDLIAGLCILVLVPLLVTFFRPVWILQGRMQDEKTRQLQAVQQQMPSCRRTSNRS